MAEQTTETSNDNFLPPPLRRKQCENTVCQIDAIDQEIQAKVLDQNPTLKERKADQHAVDAFIDALCAPNSKIAELPEYANIKPLIEERNEAVRQLVAKGGNNSTVTTFRTAAALIRSKWQMEREFKQKLCEIQPEISKENMVALDSLETSIAIHPQILEKVPQYAPLVPIVAKKNELEQQIDALNIMPAAPFKVKSASPENEDSKHFFVRFHWWGVSVDVDHEKLEMVFKTSNWSSTILGALSSVLSGPAAVLLGVLSAAIKIYGTGLQLIDQGNGIRFHIPWFAIYPLPQPMLVLPLPR